MRTNCSSGRQADAAYAADETAGVCATAGAVAGAALVAAWSIGRVLPGWAMAICIAPIVCGAAVFIPACRRVMRLSGKQAAVIFIVLVGFGLACAAAVWNGSFTAISRWAGFAMCLAIKLLGRRWNFSGNEAGLAVE